jgi:ribonuclease T
MIDTTRKKINMRFAGYLPVVVDVETAGLNASTDALLEIACVFLSLDAEENLIPIKTVAHHILPFEGANLDNKALEINQIFDPYHPFRFALNEEAALKKLFKQIHQQIKMHHCRRAVLVGHNASFDLNFIQAAIKRCKLRSPFHRFTCFDTATLAGVSLGQTVLARALHVAGISFDVKEAHSAIYDAEKTAELFCKIVNQYHRKHRA